MRKDQGRGPECRRLFPDGRGVGVVVLDECVRPSIMLNPMPRSPQHLRSRPSRQPRHRPGCPYYQGVPGNGNDPIGRFDPIANRLADALDRWAFSSITASPGARAFYGRRRSEGDSHNKALRALANHWGSASCTAASTTGPSLAKAPSGRTESTPTSGGSHKPLDTYNPGVSDGRERTTCTVGDIHNRERRATAMAVRSDSWARAKTPHDTSGDESGRGR